MWVLERRCSAETIKQHLYNKQRLENDCSDGPVLSHMCSCGSGGRAGHPLTRRSAFQSQALPFYVSLGKILNPKWPLCAHSVWVMCDEGLHIEALYECVCELVNGKTSASSGHQDLLVHILCITVNKPKWLQTKEKPLKIKIYNNRSSVFHLIQFTVWTRNFNGSL